MDILRKFLSISAAVLLMTGSIARAANVTVTGTWLNGYGNPCVYCHVDVYNLYPAGGIISAGPVQTQTDSSGDFSVSVAGGITAAIYFEETDGLVKATLPASGTITLAQIQALAPNLVSTFPPSGNLPMGGYTFINMAGASAASEPVVIGSGLDSAAIQTASGTYSFPSGATYAEVLLQGGSGGGGGGWSGASNGGGGGGSGATARCIFFASGGSLTVTIGAGGTGGASATNGSDGTATTVVQAGTTCSARYGDHGVAGSSGSAGTGGAGGSGSITYTGCTTTATPTCITVTQSPGASGANGAAGSGGGGGTGGGGAGGAPSGGSGSDGAAGKVVIWAF